MLAALDGGGGADPAALERTLTMWLYRMNDADIEASAEVVRAELIGLARDAGYHGDVERGELLAWEELSATQRARLHAAGAFRQQLFDGDALPRLADFLAADRHLPPPAAAAAAAPSPPAVTSDYASVTEIAVATGTETARRLAPPPRRPHARAPEVGLSVAAEAEAEAEVEAVAAAEEEAAAPLSALNPTSFLDTSGMGAGFDEYLRWSTGGAGAAAEEAKEEPAPEVAPVEEAAPEVAPEAPAAAADVAAAAVPPGGPLPSTVDATPRSAAARPRWRKTALALPPAQSRGWLRRSLAPTTFDEPPPAARPRPLADRAQQQLPRRRPAAAPAPAAEASPARRLSPPLRPSRRRRVHPPVSGRLSRPASLPTLRRAGADEAPTKEEAAAEAAEAAEKRAARRARLAAARRAKAEAVRQRWRTAPPGALAAVPWCKAAKAAREGWCAWRRARQTRRRCARGWRR